MKQQKLIKPQGNDKIFLEHDMKRQILETITAKLKGTEMTGRSKKIT